MLDTTDMEERAIRHARRSFAEALSALDLMTPFFDRSPAEIDGLIMACVRGFQEGMQRQAFERDPLDARPRVEDGHADDF